jgi:hypothetical protein
MPHLCDLLSKRMSVVLDFAPAAKTRRAWFRELIERAHVVHELHFVDARQTPCAKRSFGIEAAGYPAGTHWTTEENFEAINSYFQPPSEDSVAENHRSIRCRPSDNFRVLASDRKGRGHRR